MITSGNAEIIASHGGGAGGSVGPGAAGQIGIYGAGNIIAGSSSIPSAITATTQAPGTNTGQIATTAFVTAAIAIGITSPNAFFFSAGHEQPAICAVAFEPACTSANHVNAVLFYLASGVTINKISIYVGVGAAGASFNAGIYSQTGALLADSGAIACTTAQNGTVVVSTNTSIGVTVGPGWYYFAWACTSTVPTFLAQSQNMLAAFNTLRGGTPRSVLASTNLAAGALPLSLGTFSGLSAGDIVYNPTVLFSTD